MKRPALTFVTSVCLLLLLLVASHATAAAKDTWTSVRSQNFFLVGNASEKEIRRVATRLEQFRDVFARLFTQAKTTSPVPTTVIVFKSDSSYKPFKPLVDGKISELAGYFQSGEDVNYITLTTERRGDDPFSIIYHEYVHLIVDSSLGRTAVPPWFNEGLAEYYSTFDIEDDRKVYLGRLIDNHLLLLRQQQLFPLKTLFEVDHHSLHRNKRDAKGMFYAQSWALVHYLILGNDGQRLPQMGKFLALLSRNVPTEQAFREAFQSDFAAMEKELKRYIQGQSFRGQVATFERKLEFDATMQSAPLSEAEAEGYLGDLLLHTGRPDEAAARLQRAVELDPQLGMAHASLGMARMRQKRFDEAKRHLRQAVAANAQNHLAHYYYAYTLSREGMNESGLISGYTPETAREMRSALQKAIALKPDFPESYHLLAWINLITNEQLDEGIELIKRALSLAPGDEEYAFVLAQLYLRRENFDAARRTAEPLARTGADPQIRANAQSFLSAITTMREQLERYKSGQDNVSSVAAGEEPSSGGETPRLLRRRTEVSEEARGGKTEEEMVAEALAEAVREALRKPLEGETRVQGLLTRVDCSAKGIILHIKVSERVVKLQSESFDRIHIIAFTPEAGGEIGCGPRKPESMVIVTYRASTDVRAKTDGVVVAMEFVPVGFKLK